MTVSNNLNKNAVYQSSLFMMWITDEPEANMIEQNLQKLHTQVYKLQYKDILKIVS